MKSWRSVTSKLLLWLPVWLAALWWASLTTIGLMVVPMLFMYLPTPAMAGGMAAKLFSAQTWVSTVCSLLLLLTTRSDKAQAHAPAAQAVIVFIVAGMLLALLSEFAVAPKIVAHENLRFWHSVGSVMFLLQCLCAAATFGKLVPPRQTG